ncbi:interleukin-1 receptor-associated kinase 3 isoform X2 [Xiphias gladius]|uniref:interleukin-1 receptor-associated kinase 3 isoform X2 n=1 Tax=Xiphias gladius TaxID=8245 RepID=UPI001A9A11CB|nr:interleukin-1 receptor-associated kinase 3 isoform X2 [Xiphias gladius]
MDPSTFLYDVPPVVVERLCKVVDSGDDSLGWRGLAVRVLPSLLEVRMLERLEAAGRSPTRELLWSWAQKNARVRDLLRVLQDMGHHRALQLFQSQARGGQQRSKESPPPPSSQHTEAARRMPAAQVQESLQLEAASSSPASSPVKSAGESLPPAVTFRDVVEGTRDFHCDTRVAEGRFSSVYRARIGNEMFAVKLFKQDGEHPLSWQERLTIIKGVAKALHHLHTAQPCPVICGNISSDNILLDDALEPKLSDFGLARLRPHSATQDCTITLDTSCHSNLGYLPEEYIRDGKLSFSLDVYSFGTVIMESVTGRKVVVDVPKQTLLRDLLVTEVEESGGVDSCLRFLDEAAGPWPTAVALSLLALALDCTSSRQRHRPSMENVILALSQLLPPPRCPHADQPHSLADGAPANAQQSPSPSIPVEHDEQCSLPGSPTQARPCECSQSEVTYLGDAMEAHGEADLYSSWPVQCSCPAETGGLACEDCRANGFTPYHTESPQTDFGVVENPAKERLRNKLSLYDRGLIHTEDLLSETGLQ